METAPRGAQVLVVDDDELTRQSLSELLEGAGYSVATAADGRQAMGYLQEQERAGALPRVVVLDLVMPVSGWEFRAEQRADSRLAGIPLVIISGVYQPGPAAVSLGAAAFLPNPIDGGLMLAIVQRYCRTGA